MFFDGRFLSFFLYLFRCFFLPKIADEQLVVEWREHEHGSTGSEKTPTWIGILNGAGEEGGEGNRTAGLGTVREGTGWHRSHR